MIKKVIAIVCLSLFLFSGSSVVFAQEDDIRREIDEFHLKLKTKNKARTQALTHHGRVLYQYNVTNESLEGQVGNVVADSSIRKVFNYTVVKDPLISSMNSPIEIGNVVAEGGSTDVINIVEIEGDIMSIFQPISIGNVTLEEDGGTVENIVDIHGSIYAQ